MRLNTTTIKPKSTVIHWRRLDTSGSESALLSQTADGWTLSGHAVFLEEEQSCGLRYEIECNQEWQTQTVKVLGHIGTEPCDILIQLKNGSWTINGEPCPDVTGCVDIDLGFSPSTNLLPIRRLDLQTGQKEQVKAAWLKFPEMILVPLEQSYTKQSESAYLYESRGGVFTADLEVNRDGFVTVYPDLWEEALPLGEQKRMEQEILSNVHLLWESIKEERKFSVELSEKIQSFISCDLHEQGELKNL
ncbi:MAG: putative glycolipid-binding domain-containing protein, partial [Chloroflexota bacterium]